MRVAQHRRLTPLLIGACVLVALLLAALLSGVGRHVHWRAATDAASLPAQRSATSLPSAPPLEHYADIWQRPLFNRDRRPAPTTTHAGDATLGDLELTGIIITPSLRMALLRNRKTGAELRVRKGASVGDGRWTLHAVAARTATFDGPGGHTLLPLKVAAQIDRTTRPGSTPNAATGNASGAVHVGPPNRPASKTDSHNMSLQPASSTQIPTAPQIKTGNAQKARIKALQKRIQERRRQRQSTTHDGDH